MHHRASYRRDIDGLRAIAVSSVIWFHYGVPLPEWARLPGGFTGVDVFFVISGFLITRQLFADIEAGQFSILRFYDRRLRRILPALIVMLLAVLFAGRLLLMPGDYVSLAASTAAAAFGASNLYFLFHTGYFDQTAALMPLLHTWSLGVEEQFYLAWPLLLFGAHRLVRSTENMAAIAAAVTLIGFGAMLVWLDADPKGAFYLVAPRAWELSIGAMLVFLPALPRRLGFLSVSLGLALIVSGFFAADAAAFPGPVALLPCIGAALVIWPRQADNLFARWLGFLSPLGLISYSLYLWHWPVWVLFRVYINNGEPRIREAIALLAVSMVISRLSYAFVEQPIRRRKWPEAQPIKMAAAACMLVFCAAMFIHSDDGEPQRLPSTFYAMRSLDAMWDWKCPEQRAFSGIDPMVKTYGENRVCVFGRPWDSAEKHAVLWGDSHAEHMAPLLQRIAFEANTSVLLFRSCPIFIHAPVIRRHFSEYAHYDEICASIRTQMLNFIDQHPEIGEIILTAAWSSYLSSIYAGQDATGASGDIEALVKSDIAEVVERLTSEQRRVVFLGEVPQWNHDPVPCEMRQFGGLLRRNCGSEDSHILRAAYLSQQGVFNQMLSDTPQSQPNVRVISPGASMCKDRLCLNAIDGEPLYRDASHIRRNLKDTTKRDLATLMGLNQIFDYSNTTTSKSSGLLTEPQTR